jgi:hypothetical protein
MTKLLFPLLALGAAALASCHASTPTLADAPTLGNTPGMPAPTAAAAPGAPTEAAARAAVAHYIQPLREAALYALDSARVNDNGPTWQVLVPRTDWAGRMPNRARFEVDKQTGQVSGQPVK